MSDYDDLSISSELTSTIIANLPQSGPLETHNVSEYASSNTTTESRPS